ncbi:MFS transporter [Sphingomonas glacialis]|uniref:MFS transporter n=2 Tax=Sphingomonas glacialis TaxID=658225 RepID=A0A502FFX2_9SPHN|nr:MFS transporter [Sphingomonas glacialis]
METEGSAGAPSPIRDRRFVGLAMLEFWERFAMTGVKSLLVLILADQIFAGDLPRAFGAGVLRDALGQWFGPLSTTGLASQVYGYAGALLYLSVPLGGLIGDYVGNRRALLYLAAGAMLVGLLLMLQVTGFLPGLALFMAATGTLKGNLSVQVGQLFASELERQRGYAIYLGFLNAGAICGPLVCGTLAALAGWTYAIAAAALAVLIGILGYAVTTAGSARLIGDVTPDARQNGSHGRAVLPSSAILVAAILSIYFCWAAYEQVSDIFLLWARARVELHIAGWLMPVAWFVSLDGIFTLLLIVGAQALFPWLARRGIALGAQDHILLGGLACAGGYLVLALAASQDGALSIGWALAYLVLVDLAVVLVWPSGLSLIAAVAPPRFVGLWTGIFYLHGFFASLWVGISGGYYGRIPDSWFWAIQAGVAGIGVLLAVAAAALRHRSRRLQATTTSA